MSLPIPQCPDPSAAGPSGALPKLGWWIVLPAGAGLLVLCSVAFLGRGEEAILGFPLDDAWIHLVYGRSLASEGLLAFNPGTPATGATSPLWAIGLAACHLALGWLSTDAVIVGVMVLGAALFLLAVALATDLAWRVLGRRQLAIAAGLAVAVAGLAGAVATVGPVSERLQNDVRNVHEVQRAMGEWIARSTAPGTWVAASDVGAVRYFSDRPVIDLMGLNTPELYWEKETFVPEHPVRVLAVMPRCLRFRGDERLRVLARMRTDRYTVTSWPEMAEQEILTCTRPARLEYRGRRSGVIECRPLGRE